MFQSAGQRSVEWFSAHHMGLRLGLFTLLYRQLREHNSPSVAALFHLLFLATSLWLSSARCKRMGPAALLCVSIALGPWGLPLLSSRSPARAEEHLLFQLREIGELTGSGRPMWSLQGRVELAEKESEWQNTSLRAQVLIPAGSIDTRLGRWRLRGRLYQHPFSKSWQLQTAIDTWIPAPTLSARCTGSWARWRFERKKALSKWIAQCLPPTPARSMIIGLCTGRQGDRRLSYTLSQVGLAHLLAVSGFHFVCVLGFCESLLRFKGRAADNWLLVPAVGYFMYMGPTASVFRAGAMSVCRVLARQTGRSYRPLQALGLSLTLWCLFWPDQTRDLGFILSYLCTAALLLLSQSVRTCLDFLWPEDRLQQIVASRAGDRGRRVARRLRAWLRAALSANLSAHLALLAPALHYWHFLPISSLWWNLLVPPCVGLLMQLLLVAIATAPLFPSLSRSLLKLAHFLLEPLLGALRPTRAWECQIWAECGADVAIWITALLLLFGLFSSARAYRPEPLDRWIC